MCDGETTIGKFLHRLKRPFAERVIRRWRELNAPILDRIKHKSGFRFWQTGGGYDRNIYSGNELIEKANYIHENPVRRGLAKTSNDYEWSSARFFDGLDAKLKCDPLPN